MITVNNIQRLENIEFEDYKKLPGVSFSFLKRERQGIAEEIQQTHKMALGTMVDSLLTGVGAVDISSKLYPPAKEIAFRLRTQFSSVLRFLKPQISFTATFEHKGFFLDVHGRPDFEFPQRFVVDLKICHSNNIRSVIEYMRYEDQCFGYGKMAGVRDAYLMVYCVPKKCTEIIHIPIGDTNLFWQHKILEHGSIKAA